MLIKGINSNIAMVQIAIKLIIGLRKAKPALDNGKPIGPAKYYLYIKNTDKLSSNNLKDKKDALKKGLTLKAIINVSKLINIAKYAKQ